MPEDFDYNWQHWIQPQPVEDMDVPEYRLHPRTGIIAEHHAQPGAPYRLSLRQPDHDQ